MDIRLWEKRVVFKKKQQHLKSLFCVVFVCAVQSKNITKKERKREEMIIVIIKETYKYECMPTNRSAATTDA